MGEQKAFADVLRTERKDYPGYSQLSLLGLNIFQVRDQWEDAYWPQREFMRRVEELSDRSVWLITSEMDLEDVGLLDAQRSEVGLDLVTSNDRFYVVRGARQRVLGPPLPWKEMNVERFFDFDYWMLLWGADEIDRKISKINMALPDLVEATELKEEALVGHLLSAFPATLNSAEDGYYFKLRTQDEGILSAVIRAFAEVASILANDPWVLEHVAELKWDEEHNCCLMLPSEIVDKTNKI